MTPNQRNWVFSFLWVNAAVVVVVLILIAGNQISIGRQLLRVLVYSLFYANLTGFLGLLILGGLVGNFSATRPPFHWWRPPF
jgi:hypothetical protein